jgi:hypothetical protein
VRCGAVTGEGTGWAEHHFVGGGLSGQLGGGGDPVGVGRCDGMLLSMAAATRYVWRLGTRVSWADWAGSAMWAWASKAIWVECCRKKRKEGCDWSWAEKKN